MPSVRLRGRGLRALISWNATCLRAADQVTEERVVDYKYFLLFPLLFRDKYVVRA